MPRVLVIDDLAMIRAMCRDELEGAGFEVVEAGDGQEGLEVLAATAPDAVVVDLVMPRMDGLEFLLELRRRGHGDLPVVVLTAIEDQAERMALAAAPTLRVLVKPMEPGALAEALRDLRRVAQAG